MMGTKYLLMKGLRRFSHVEILIVVMICLVAYAHISAPNMPPIFGDDWCYINYYNQNNWDIWKVAKSDFQTFKFYRIVGNSINFIFYYFFADFPKIMYALVTISLFFVLYLYSRFFEIALHEKKQNCHILILLTFFAVPFSFFLILYRHSFPIIISYYLIALCVWLIYSSSLSKEPIIFLFTAAMIYGLSLFNYEVSLFMFLYFFTLLFTNPAQNKKNKFSYSILFVILLLLFFFAYTYSQFFYIGSQPKLQTPVPGYFINQDKMTLWMQLIRKILYFSYYIKWSYLYTYTSIGRFDLSTLILICSIISIGVYLFWRVLSEQYLNQNIQHAKMLMTHGIVFFISSFGIWSYYWYTKKLLVTPPLYHLFLPTLGISLIIVGLLNMLSLWVFESSILRIALCLIFIGGIVTNLCIFLSSRTAIAQTHDEAKAYAKNISELSSSDTNRYTHIVLLDLPAESIYLRYKTEFNYFLKFYLMRTKNTWSSIKIIGNNVIRGDDKTLKIYPGGEIVSIQNVLLLHYNQANSFDILPSSAILGEVLSEPKDPFMISIGRYKLYCSANKADIILEAN